jgi:RNA polymerase sigma-70 factor (ECF subfamily)
MVILVRRCARIPAFASGLVSFHFRSVQAKQTMEFGEFTTAVAKHHAPLFRFAYRLTGSAADAEDIVQECFLGLLRSDSRFDSRRTPLRTYLFGAVRNQAAKRRRSPENATPEVETPPDLRSPEWETLRVELETRVSQAVFALPQTQREVLILAHYEQMPLTEIAVVVGIEVGAVKSRLQRARCALRETLAEYAERLP